jgi:DNA-binding transcriptional MocR family regulator
VDQARRAGMNPQALSSRYYASTRRQWTRLGYGNTPAERFAPLIKQLGKIAKSLN